MNLEQKVYTLIQKVEQHNKDAAKASAQKDMLLSQRDKILEEIKSFGYSNLEEIAIAITSLESEINGIILDIESRL